MFLLQARYNGQEPRPASPQEFELPLVKSFDNGLAEIRSSWQADATVMALKTGAGTRCNYSHDRPNRNAIVMAACGEYLLVTPNSANYRSQKRFDWDMRTSSYNTLTIDNSNQLTPGVYIFPGFPLDVSGIPKGKPVAKLDFISAGKFVDSMQSDAAEAYTQLAEKAQRTVMYVKDKGYFCHI
jgi:hypothetical protein